jgi:hypothetical protein
LELLLNLFWLLLAFPAFWIWRQAEDSQPGCRVHSRRCMLLVACVVLLLFPIISASDDLQAMRPEVEESTSRDTQRHAQGCRQATSLDHARIFAVPLPTDSLIPQFACLGLAVTPSPRAVVALSVVVPSGRAPPISFLA